jgi:hypothetical protein
MFAIFYDSTLRAAAVALIWDVDFREQKVQRLNSL